MEKPFFFGFPLKQKFVEFVYGNGNILPHELPMISQLWDVKHAEEAKLTGGAVDDALRKTTIMGIDNNEANAWLYNRLAEFALRCNNEHYYFDLQGFYEPLQLMRYGSEDHFDWHLDFGPGAHSERKLSITVQLSDEDAYEGGDLEFMVNKEYVKAPREQGTVIVFPSFIMHRVTPVTKGTRESIVGWIAGPPFR